MPRPYPSLIALAAGTLSLVVAVGTASADGYVPRSAPPCCAFSWTGAYFGMNAGYGLSNDQRVRVDEFDTGTPVFNGNFGSLSPAGAFGGVQFGANLQMGSVVLGVEGDLQWSDLRDEASATVSPYVTLGNSISVATSNAVERFGTLRPRIGIAFDRSLIYATAGYAWGEVRHTITMSDTFGFTADDRRLQKQGGYVVGGGFEHAFSSDWSLKVEYQYINLGSSKHETMELDTSTFTTSAFKLSTDTQTDFHTVRLGLNYKFGPK